MKTKWILLLLILLFPAFCLAAEGESKDEHDRAIVSIFAQPGLSFLGFDDREKFQTATDSIFRDLREEAHTAEESTAVSRQMFQKVNMAFPISGGIQIQPFEDHFVSVGVGFIYDNEEIVLTDRLNKTHSYGYTLQAVPLFLEYRLAISNNFLSMNGESLFSVAFRWYWMLPGTEIYSSWGRLEAEPDPLGSGFGISAGYLIGSWKNFKLYGDLGYTSISLKSKDTFAKIVPLYDKPDEVTGESESTRKAKWDLGGLQFQIRVSFGVWNKPAPVEETDSLLTRPRNVVKDSLMRDSIKVDSVKTDSVNVDSAKVDSVEIDTAMVDSAKVDTVKIDSTKKDSKADTISTEQPAQAPSDSSNAPVPSEQEPPRQDAVEPKE